MANRLSVAGVRTLLGKLGVGSALTVAGATNASPSVVNVTAHGLSVGDLLVISGVTGNTALNGLRQVAHVTDADHFDLTDVVAGTAVNGNGTTGGTILCNRVFSSLVPGDAVDLTATLDEYSSKGGPFQDNNRAAETAIQTIVGA